MLTGWPVGGPLHLQTFTHDLYEFRFAAEDAGLLDKYHSDDKPHWKDDDFFMRLGTFSRDIGPDQLSAIQESMREFLAARQPIAVEVNVRDVSIVLYDHSSLKKEHVRARIPLTAFLEDYSHVDRLYHRIAEGSRQ
jgi:hypothetical protein